MSNCICQHRRFLSQIKASSDIEQHSSPAITHPLFTYMRLRTKTFCRHSKWCDKCKVTKIAKEDTSIYE